MARNQSIEIRKILNRIVPKAHLEELAHETGAWRRRRKISASWFFWTVVLGFSVGNHRTIAGLRRSFEKAVGRSIVPSAFYDRFTPKFVTFLKAILAEVMDKMSCDLTPLKEHLATFRDILITDSTLIRLHDMLEGAFPSVWTHFMKASVKAHVVLSVRAGGMNSVKLSPGSQHDGPRFRAGAWMRGKLLIFDLGYYGFPLFSRIDSFGGYFLSRLKQNANPRVVRRSYIGKERAGWPLKVYLKRHPSEQPLDLDARFEFFEFQNNKGKKRYHRARIVGVFNHQSQRYHFYVTNVPRTVLTPEQLAKVYGSRWLIELLFRELKKNFRMAEIPSKKRHVVEALVYAALIALLVSRCFLAELRRTIRLAKDKFPEERWAAIWATISSDLLAILLRSCRDRVAEKYLMLMIQREAADPNRSRKLLLERAFG